MTVSIHTYSASVAGHALEVIGGRLAWDESWAPQVQGEIEIALPDQAVYDLLDPRSLVRVLVNMAADYTDLNPAPLPPTAIAANLGLRGREATHDGARVRLTLESDEALLLDDVLGGTNPSTGGLAYKASIRSLVNWVLARKGTALQPGTADAAQPINFNTTNLITNPSLQTDAAGWTSFPGDLTLVRSGATAWQGTTSLQATATAGSFQRVLYADTLTPSRPISGGAWYWFSVWARLGTGATPTACSVTIRWQTRAGGLIDMASGTPVTLSTTFQRVTVGMRAPTDAVYAQPSIYLAANIAGGSAYYFDGAMLAEGIELFDYFDGATPAAGGYTYAWTGTAGSSTSTRTVTTEEHPESALVWPADLAAWDYLQPIVQAAGLRLFCDEQRRWYLVDGKSYIAPGSLALSAPGNLISADEELSRDLDEWFDASLVRYRWLDAAGGAHEKIDWYASGGYTKISAIEINRPYPAYGFSAYRVQRAKGLGRVFTLRAVSRYDVRPSQPVVATVPATAEQSGVVRRVEFDLAADEMTISTRGLTAVVTGSWSAVDPATPWNAIPGDPAWNAWVPTV